MILKIYDLIGAYLGGLFLICSINATLACTMLAIVEVPFFLPLGLASGFSNLVPYAGPIVMGLVITGMTMLTLGVWKGVACAIFFVIYGQLEEHPGPAHLPPHRQRQPADRALVDHLLQRDRRHHRRHHGRPRHRRHPDPAARAAAHPPRAVGSGSRRPELAGQHDVLAAATHDRSG